MTSIARYLLMYKVIIIHYTIYIQPVLGNGYIDRIFDTSVYVCFYTCLTEGLVVKWFRVETKRFKILDRQVKKLRGLGQRVDCRLEKLSYDVIFFTVRSELETQTCCLECKSYPPW